MVYLIKNYQLKNFFPKYSLSLFVLEIWQKISKLKGELRLYYFENMFASTEDLEKYSYSRKLITYITIYRLSRIHNVCTFIFLHCTSNRKLSLLLLVLPSSEWKIESNNVQYLIRHLFLNGSERIFCSSEKYHGPLSFIWTYQSKIVFLAFAQTKNRFMTKLQPLQVFKSTFPLRGLLLIKWRKISFFFITYLQNKDI